MKLYLVVNAPASMRWQASKAEAEKLCRAYGGEPEARQIAENGREELAECLNARELFVQREFEPEGQVTATAGVALPAPVVLTPAQHDAANPRQYRSGEDIVAFILDEAPVHIVENILAALGTRVAELAKGAR